MDSDVNLTGALYTIYLAMTHFRTQEKDSDGMRGKLIVTGSNAMIYPFPADVLYGSAKTGLLGTVRSLAPRFALEGMTVNALAPALVQTVGLHHDLAITRLTQIDRDFRCHPIRKS